MQLKKTLKQLWMVDGGYWLAVFSALILPHALQGCVSLHAKAAIEMGIFVTFVLYATWRRAQRRQVFPNSRVNAAMIALVGFVLVSGLFAQNKPLAIKAILLFLSYVCAFQFCIAILEDNCERGSRILIWGISLVSLCVCAFGVYSWAWFPDGAHAGPLTATFGNSKQMAGWLSMSIPAFLGLILERERSTMVFILTLAVLLALILTLFFTSARGGWISTAMGATSVLMFFSFNHRPTVKLDKMKWFLSIAFCMNVCFFILDNARIVELILSVLHQPANFNLPGRFQAWIDTIEIIKANPLMGIGPGNHAAIVSTPQSPPGPGIPLFTAHNGYLQFISETGLLVVPLMLWLAYGIFSQGVEKLKQRNRRTRATTAGAMGGIIAMLIYSISDFDLYMPANTLLFTMLAAIVAASSTSKHPPY